MPEAAVCRAEQLAKQGRDRQGSSGSLPRRRGWRGVEVSLVENVQRVAMDAMDEVDAYAALVAEGATARDVASRFGVTRRHVDQRLALAGLSPEDQGRVEARRRQLGSSARLLSR
jgi:ParB-like chromosome segregation protein Spo0J